MKKILLGAFALIGTYGMAEAANILTVNNLTSCTYTISLSGGSGTTVPPGISTFSSFSYTNIDFIKIMYGTTQVNVGFGSPYSNSIGQPAPPCITNPFFTASWAQATQASNATLVIFE
ncbi:hypothetical protein DBR32_08845 [Taibaiella sp. KBW10]|uniref:hypothetical protein n=1 Tax=Taibaiella sp. KBW10 TaxID=2153357 RepID=UPI000F5A25F5|nr:hypothetical protein [Taibaiella sp. KBW10]RQO30818.1 hypothetical protein DBR32_08845 [Taibaiella sp. KBW10]